MPSAGVVGATVGCFSALVLIIAFIIFRYKVKKDEASCWGFGAKTAPKYQVFISVKSWLAHPVQ